MGLIEKLNETKNLQGDEMDMALLAIKEKYTTQEDKEVIRNFLLKECDEIEAELKEVNSVLDKALIRKSIEDNYKLLPISYIAKHYFGKSASWLYQRINGNKVRGKVYSLNKEEINIFNRALKEIGNEISSMSISF